MTITPDPYASGAGALSLLYPLNASLYTWSGSISGLTGVAISGKYIGDGSLLSGISVTAVVAAASVGYNELKAEVITGIATSTTHAALQVASAPHGMGSAAGSNVTAFYHSSNPDGYSSAATLNGTASLVRAYADAAVVTGTNSADLVRSTAWQQSNATITASATAYTDGATNTLRTNLQAQADSKYLALIATNQYAIDLTNRTIQAIGSTSTGGLASIALVISVTNDLRTNLQAQADAKYALPTVTNGLVGAEVDPLLVAASNTFARAASTNDYLRLDQTNQYAIDITNRTIQAIGDMGISAATATSIAETVVGTIVIPVSNLAAAASAASGSNTAWLAALAPSQAVDRAIIGTLSNTVTGIANGTNDYLRREGATGNSLMTGPLGMGAQPITNVSYIMSSGVSTGGGRLIIGRRQYPDGGFPFNIDAASYGSALFGYIGGVDTPQIVNSPGSVMVGNFTSENTVISNSVGCMVLGNVNSEAPWSAGDQGPEIVGTRGGLVLGDWGGGRIYIGGSAHGSIIMGANVSTNYGEDFINPGVNNGGATNHAVGSILQFGWHDYVGNHTAWIKEGADMSIGQGDVVVSNPMCIVSGQGQVSHGSATHTAENGFWHGTTNILTQMTNEVSQKLFGGTNIIAQMTIISNAIVAGGSTTDTVARAWLDTLTASQQVDRAWLGLLDGSNQVTRTMAAGATSTGQTAAVMSTGLTSTQAVHATWLGLLADSGTVTRALATRAVTNYIPLCFQSATQEVIWAFVASQDYTLKTVRGSCSNGPVLGDVVLRQLGTAWMSAILVANPSISVSTGGVNDTSWDIGVLSNGWQLGWWCTNQANGTPYRLQLEMTGNQ
jgi:hypothetical protein